MECLININLILLRFLTVLVFKFYSLIPDSYVTFLTLNQVAKNIEQYKLVPIKPFVENMYQFK